MQSQQLYVLVSFVAMWQCTSKGQSFQEFTNHAHYKMTAIKIEYKHIWYNHEDAPMGYGRYRQMQHYHSIKEMCIECPSFFLLVISNLREIHNIGSNTFYQYDQLNDTSEKNYRLSFGQQKQQRRQRAIKKEEAEQETRKNGDNIFGTKSLSQAQTNLLFLTLIQKIIGHIAQYANDQTIKHSKLQSFQLTAISKYRGKKEQACC